MSDRTCRRSAASLPSTSLAARLPAAWAIALPLALLGGCTGGLNGSDAPFGSDLPDLRTASAPIGESDAVASAAPSLTGLDRSNWQRTVITFERRQVETFPNYTTRLLYDHATARERGEAPTTTSALEGVGQPGPAVAEAFSAPVVAAWDLIAFPVRLFMTPPTTTVRAPSESAVHD